MRIFISAFVLTSLIQSCATAPKTDREAIRVGIDGQKNGVKSCYENALARNPNTNGKLELSWMIDPPGKAKTIVIMSSTVNDRTLENCVSQEMMNAKFPESTIGQLITYPFLFEGKYP